MKELINHLLKNNFDEILNKSLGIRKIVKYVDIYFY